MHQAEEGKNARFDPKLWYQRHCDEADKVSDRLGMPREFGRIFMHLALIKSTSGLRNGPTLRD